MNGGGVIIKIFRFFRVWNSAPSCYRMCIIIYKEISGRRLSCPPVLSRMKMEDVLRADFKYFVSELDSKSQSLINSLGDLSIP